jgi:hypothetical protein
MNGLVKRTVPFTEESACSNAIQICQPEKQHPGGTGTRLFSSLLTCDFFEKGRLPTAARVTIFRVALLLDLRWASRENSIASAQSQF